ncbi:MAG TPA: response regulator [Polyangia bacterium]|nr:response regulator [Polyangia bacterium]
MMQPPNLLVVDPDPRGLETLVFGFEREGCMVTATSDPRRAELLARTARPGLAIVALRDPEKPSLEAIAALREVAATLPVLAAGPSALRAEAVAAGASDFLALPIFLRDAISVGRLSIHASGAAKKPADKNGAPSPEGDAEIQMRLSEHYGLFYLLRAMAASGRSGVLQLARGNRRAEMRVHEGTLVAVSVGAMQGLPALHHLLLWEEAAVSLLGRPVPKRSQLHLSSQELLDECERFLRDFAHAAKDLGAPRTIYVPVNGTVPEVRGLQPSQMTPLLRLFDGRRGLSDVIEESPFRIFDTVRMVRRLREANVLVNRPDGPRERPPTGPYRPLQGGPNGTPRSMLEQWAMVPDQRGIVGDRRSTSRRLRPLGPAAPAPAPTPIPLVARKSPTGSNRTTSGEIPVAARRPTPAPAVALAVAPSVQVALDPIPEPLPLPPPAAVVEAPAPVQARSITGRQAPLEEAVPAPRRSGSGRHAPLEEPAPRRSGSGRHAPLEDAVPAPRRSGSGRQAALEPSPAAEAAPRARRSTNPSAANSTDAFDAVEADFFAREADLYKREAIESFDDLDRDNGASGGKRPRKKS